MQIVRWLVAGLLLGAMVAQAQAPEPLHSADLCSEGKCLHHTHWPFARTTQTEQPHAGSMYDLRWMEAHWRLDPRQRYIAGSVTLHVRATEPTDSLTFDFGDSLRVDSVRFRGQVVLWQHTLQVLRVQLPVTLLPGENDSVCIWYQGTPTNVRHNGLFADTTASGSAVLWTLSQPYHARQWWPTKQTLNDRLDSVHIRITHPVQYTAVANGLLQHTHCSDTLCTTLWAHRYSIPAYLVAVAVAAYQQHDTTIALADGDSLLVQDFFYPEKAPEFLAEKNRLIEYLRWMEATYGPYPYRREKYGSAMVNLNGGMEHSTVSFNGPVYGELWVHELAHQWFGDMITCGSWNDLWLNEGWATFVTVEWLEQYSRYEYFPIGLRNNTRSIRQGPVGAIGQPDTANVSNLFNSALRYRKPAYMLLMLREWIGETAFRAGIRAYANDTALRWNYARTPQFIGHLAAACPSCGVEHFLNTWLYSQGLPRYEVQWGLAETEGAFIRLRQTNTVEGQPVLPQVMEVAVWAHDASGQPVHDTLAVPVNTPETTVHLPPGWTPDSLLLNPERYALVDTIVYSMRSTPNQIRLWPNPASEYLTIWVPALANQPDAVAEATVWDAAGRLVARLPAQNAGPAPRFEVRLLAPGSYLLRIGEEDAMRFVRP